jgi:hypothetical protein
LELELNIDQRIELDDIIQTGYSKQLFNVRINQLEKKIIVISVKGQDYIENFNQTLDKLKNFSNHLRESNIFINDLIKNPQN